MHTATHAATRAHASMHTTRATIGFGIEDIFIRHTKGLQCLLLVHNREPSKRRSVLELVRLPCDIQAVCAGSRVNAPRIAKCSHTHVRNRLYASKRSPTVAFGGSATDSTPWRFAPESTRTFMMATRQQGAGKGQTTTRKPFASRATSSHAAQGCYFCNQCNLA